jgi:hypothetical protein
MIYLSVAKTGMQDGKGEKVTNPSLDQLTRKTPLAVWKASSCRPS